VDKGRDEQGGAEDFQAAALAALDQIAPSSSRPSTGAGVPVWLAGDEQNATARPLLDTGKATVAGGTTESLHRPIGTAERTRRPMLESPKLADQDWRNKAYSPSAPEANGTGAVPPNSQLEIMEPQSELLDLSLEDVSMPVGQHLQLCVHSNWGDSTHVGLSGIDIFDSEGQPVRLSKPEAQVSAVDGAPNALLSNIMVPPSMTCDGQQMWLEEICEDQPIVIAITLDFPTAISMIRLWNYNESRVHSTRGVRDLSLHLDGQQIFAGEVRMAPGEMVGALDCAEIILFTMAEQVLAQIELNDEAAQIVDAGEAADSQPFGGLEQTPLERPTTRGRNFDSQDTPEEEHSALQIDVAFGLGDDLGCMSPAVDGEPAPSTAPLSPTSALVVPAHLANSSERPPTGMSTRGEASDVLAMPQGDLGSSVDLRPITACAPGSPIAKRLHPSRQISPKKAAARPGTMMAAPSVLSDKPALSTRFVRFELLDTWGDVDVGLTGVEVLDVQGKPLPISKSAISIHLNDAKGHLAPHQDLTISSLVDGCNITTAEEHMWTMRFQPHTILSMDLGLRRPVWGLKLYNYNSSVNESFRGVKHFQIHLDGQPGETYSARKAPGTAAFDFGHLIEFRGSMPEETGPRPVTAQPSRSANEALHAAFERARRRMSHNELIKQDYVTPLFPYGFIIRLELCNTWGDAHYMGLNGLELYDCFNNKIPLDRGIVHATPESVQHLPGMESDRRTLDKLWDGVNATRDDRHMWLVPCTIGTPAVVHVCLQEPVSLSKVKIWNYAKTPARGVKDFSIFMDDNMVYKGRLRCAQEAPENPTPQTILFTNDADVVKSEKEHVYCSADAEAEDEGVVFLEGENQIKGM